MGNNVKIFNSTIIVTAIGGVSQVIGFFIPILIADLYGVSAEVDAYYFSISVPNLVIGIIIGGSIKIIFIPIYIKEQANNPDKLRDFVNQVFTFLLILSIVIAGLIAFLTKFGLFNFIVDESTSHLVNKYVLYTLPLIPLTITFQFFNAIYNAHQKFALLEVANAVKYTVTFLCIYFFHEKFGLIVAIVGQTIGQTFTLAISFLVLRYFHSTSLRFNIRFKKTQLGLLKMSSLALGAFIFAQLTPFFLKIVAGLLESGSISVIGYAERLSIIPSFIIGSSFSVVLTSYWSKMHFDKLSSALEDSFNKTMSALTVILVPIVFGLSYLSDSLVELLFLGENFDLQAVKITALVFALFIVQTLPTYYNNVLSRILHINQDLKYLFKFSLISFILNTILIFLLAIETPLGVLGIPTGLILGRGLTVCANTIYVHRKYVRINFRNQSIGIAKVVLSSAVMLGVMFGTNLWINLFFDLSRNLSLTLVSNVVIGATSYIFVLKLLRHIELEAILKIVKNKIQPSR